VAGLARRRKGDVLRQVAELTSQFLGFAEELHQSIWLAVYELRFVIVNPRLISELLATKTDNLS